MEEGKENLKRAIDQLANKKAPNNLWDSIEDKLEDFPTESNYEVLQEAIEKLPNKSFNADVFDAVIENTQPKRIRINWQQWAVAASIALTVGFFVMNKNGRSETIKITYSEQTIEQAPVELVAFTDLHTQDEVLSFIKSNCKAFELECDQEGFKVLLDEYLQLETDRQELMEAIKYNKEETQLVQYLVRLEKKKTQLGKQLMQTFI